MYCRSAHIILTQNYMKIFFSALSREGVNSKVFYFSSKSMDTSKIDGNEKFIISKSYNNLERFLYFLKHKRVYDDLKKNNLDFELSHAHSLFSNGYIAYKLKKIIQSHIL